MNRVAGMAGGLYRASRAAGRLITLSAVSHSVAIALSAWVVHVSTERGEGSTAVTGVDPGLALRSAAAHAAAVGLSIAAARKTEDGSVLSFALLLYDGAAGAVW